MKLFAFYSGKNSVFFGIDPYLTFHILEQPVRECDIWLKKIHKYGNYYQFGIIIFGVWITISLENI